MHDSTNHDVGRAGQQSGRDEHGRFVVGNKGGPGNPFARQTARLRKAMLAVVTDEDMQAIAAKLIELARGGDVAAAKVLLAYVIGRPAEAVDPDTVDIHEFQLYHKATAGAEAMGHVIESLPVETACSIVRAVRPILAEAKRKDLLERFQNAEEEEACDDDDGVTELAEEPTGPETAEQDLEAVQEGLRQQPSEWAEGDREPARRPAKASPRRKRERAPSPVRARRVSDGLIVSRPSINGGKRGVRPFGRPSTNGDDGRQDDGGLHDRG
jgi:hypothetical protein